MSELHRRHQSSDAIGWYPISWEDGFRASGFDVPHFSPVMVGNNYPLLLEAAINGEGIVLGWQHLVQSKMNEGKLCRWFDMPLRVDRGNYLKVNKAALDKPHGQQFVDLILADVAASEREHR